MGRLRWVRDGHRVEAEDCIVKHRPSSRETGRDQALGRLGAYKAWGLQHEAAVRVPSTEAQRSSCNHREEKLSLDWLSSVHHSQPRAGAH